MKADLASIRDHVNERFSEGMSTRRSYNSLMSPASLLFIAESVGIVELTVRLAFEAAVAENDHRRACGAIRKIITRDMVYSKM